MEAAYNVQKDLSSIFPGITSVDGINDCIDHLSIINVNVRKKARKLEIFLSSDIYISSRIISNIEQYLRTESGLNSVDVYIIYSCAINGQDEFMLYWDNVLYCVFKRCAFAKAILADSCPELNEGKLKIRLKTAGAEVLRSKSCNEIIEEVFKIQFNKNVRVEFIDPVLEKEIIKEYREKKIAHEEKIIKEAITIKKETKQEDKKNAEKTAGDSDGKVILGKEFSDQTVDINTLTFDSGKVAICGDIIAVDSREIKGGKTLYMFDVTDYSSSVTVKFFCSKDNAARIAENLKTDIKVKIRGEAQYDKFSKELTIMASDIFQVAKEFRMDTAENKRVELHVHTQMSQMDGISSASEIIKRAAKWGHSAIAITDHGVVQAYPEAYEAGKKNNVKIIYGIECYLVDDTVSVDYSATNYSLDDEFVAFDIETTGLKPETDKIIEIGAVKIKNGEIVDKFSTFVNPMVPIPEEITKLTGINESMVKDAPPAETAVGDFIKFIGNSVIIAHNAGFDLGFLRLNAEKAGLRIENTVIDTLELSRKMFPKLSRHKLGIVAEHIGLDVENCHRALDDATMAVKIFMHCVNEMKKKGAKTVYDVQKELRHKLNYNELESHHAIILVKNQTGLKNLYRMVSISHLEYFYKKPRIPKSVLTQYREGLIVGSACESGELYSSLVKNKPKEEIDRIIRFYDYLEIQPLGNNEFLVNSGAVESTERLKELNRKIVAFGEQYDKPVIAACDVHFLDEKDEIFRKMLMAGQGYNDADRHIPLFFRTTNEMLAEFEYLGEEKAYEVVVKNTQHIAEMIEHVIPIPEETFPPKIEGAEEEIRQLAESRAKEIYGENLPEIVKNRLERELNSIIKNGFSVMYIIAQKLVSKSLSDGYLVGSRGSVGSSFAATMAGITEVNPLPPHYVCPECKHTIFIEDGSVGCGADMEDKNCPECGAMMKKDGYDIPFETFLGFDGDKEPDIDLNFSGDYQPRAHKYIEELFGADHVFRAGTIATIADKTAYGFVKNYLDERGKVVTNAEINRLVKGCTGIKRTTGQHPGGLMIVPQDNDIHNFCPIQRPADDTGSDVITTHFDYHSISGRLLKLDILGHDDPTVIRMLEDLTGVDARKIPIGDKTIMGIFSGTEPLGIKPEDINSPVGTFGIPEFGTKFVRQMLVDTKPKTFSELVRISGLSHGTDVWLNNAQELIRSGTATLKETICTRDDIMTYLLHKGLQPKTAFKIMEDVRKGKGVKEEYEQAMKEKNVPGWYIDSCKKIKYMFPKAHAAAYVMMAFRIAWFKVYHPEAFYVAYFTVRADEFDAGIMTVGQDAVKNKIKEIEQRGNEVTQKEKNMLTILEVANEMYARGIKFLPVDLYKSDPSKFLITPEGIRPPLNTLQGLGGSAAQNIAEARKNGPFLSIDDLKVRAKASKSIIEILQQNGCIEGLPESNQISLF